MEDAEGIRMLAELGMDEMSFRALALLPMVQVAWADGEMHEAERALILDLSQSRFDIGDEGRLLLQNWLRYRPSVEYLALGRRTLLAVVARDPAHGLGEDVLEDVLRLSRAVAKAAGGLFGIGSVSRSESEALDEIGSALHIAPGTPLDQAKRGAEPAPLPSRNRVTITFSSTTTLDLSASNAVIEPDPDLGVSHKIPVDRNGVTIGTDPLSDLKVDHDGRVSALHCRFIERNRKYYVADLDSETGTWVNGERIAERRLLGGEEVRVGDVKMAFKLLRRIPAQMF